MTESNCRVCGNRIDEQSPYIIDRSQTGGMLVRTYEHPVCAHCAEDYLVMLTEFYGDVVLNEPEARTGHALTPDHKPHQCFHCGKPMPWNGYLTVIQNSTRDKNLTKVIHCCSECMDDYREIYAELFKKRRNDRS